MNTNFATEENLLSSFDGGVLRILLNRPERKNSFTDQMVLDLVALVEAAGHNSDIRVIHLSAVGQDFCSGFDLGERQQSTSKPVMGSIQRRMETHVNRLIQAMCFVQKPIVVTARGWVIGLGLGLLLAADFAIVESDATLWAPFTDLGFTPDSGVSFMLPATIGSVRARRMLLLAEKVSGTLAAEWGMVHESVAADALDQTSNDLVAQLSGAATIAIGQSKKLLHLATESTLAAQLAAEGWAMELTSRSDDFKENVVARREKRRPRFTGT